MTTFTMTNAAEFGPRKELYAFYDQGAGMDPEHYLFWGSSFEEAYEAYIEEHAPGEPWEEVAETEGWPFDPPEELFDEIADRYTMVNRYVEDDEGYRYENLYVYRDNIGGTEYDPRDPAYFMALVLTVDEREDLGLVTLDEPPDEVEAVVRTYTSARGDKVVMGRADVPDMTHFDLDPFLFPEPGARGWRDIEGQTALVIQNINEDEGIESFFVFQDELLGTGWCGFANIAPSYAMWPTEGREGLSFDWVWVQQQDGTCVSVKVATEADVQARYDPEELRALRLVLQERRSNPKLKNRLLR